MIHKSWDVNEHNTGRFHNGKPVKGVTFQNGLNDIEPDGSFVPCDMNIEAANIGVTTHKIKRGRYGQLRLGDTTTNKPLIKIKDKDMKGISLQYVNGGNGNVIVGDKKASFPEVDGVGIEITPYYKGVKVELVISDPQTAPVEYPFSLKDYGQEYSYEIVNGAIIGTGEDGKKVTLHAPYAIDGNGETGQVNYVMTGVVNNLQTFKKVVDETWLRSRIGEVRIDPDVTIDDTTGTFEDACLFTDTALKRDWNNGAWNLAQVQDGFTTLGYSTQAQKVGLTAYSGKTVLNGKYSVYIDSWSGTTFDYGIYPINQAWNEGNKTFATASNNEITGKSAMHNDAGTDWAVFGCQGSGTDHSATEAGSGTFVQSVGWFDMTLTVASIQAKIDGANYGDIIKPKTPTSTNRWIRWQSSEGANQPLLYFEYTEGGAQILRRRMEGY
jgi:hypothetical protein